MKNNIIFLLLCFFVSSCSSYEKTNNQAVLGFDIDKYLGRWYEIARLDHAFERGCSNVYADYKKISDDKIKVINRCVVNEKEKVANGVAHFADKKDVGHLKVSFFRPFYGDYKVVYLTKDYSIAIIDGGNKGYFWILSRQKIIKKNQLKKLLIKAESFGFDTSKLIFTKHNNYNDK